MSVSDAYLLLLQATSLFAGIPSEELPGLLEGYGPRVRQFRRGETLLRAGEENREIGILLEGKLSAAKPLPDGGEVLITRMGPGGIFGDVLAGSSVCSPVTLLAEADCAVLFLACRRIIRPAEPIGPGHYRVLQNLIGTISDKYFALDRRIGLLVCRSLRARISIWLGEEAQRRGSTTFRTGMTRASLARYLNCDRSALSRELSRMQADGLVEVYRGSFRLLDEEGLKHAAAAG